MCRGVVYWCRSQVDVVHLHSEKQWKLVVTVVKVLVQHIRIQDFDASVANLDDMDRLSKHSSMSKRISQHLFTAGSNEYMVWGFP